MPIIMNPNKDKIASLILASRAPDGSESMQEGPEVQQDSSIGLESAAQKILSAIEAKDAKMLAGGLQDFLALADTDESEPAPDIGV